MKKLLTSISLCAILFSSCLKDKGFDNNEYGINLNDGSAPAVAFLRGAAAKTTFGVNVDPGAQDVELVIQYTGETAPSSDVSITLAVDNSLIASYNTANMASVQALPASAITIPTTFVIPSGQRFASLKLKINNTTVLNPNIEYGVGIRIAAVSGGVKIASNLEKVLVTINIKNKYDGKYDLVFSNYHPTLNPGYTGATTKVELFTTGPNSVSVYWPLNTSFTIPAILSGGFSAFGGQSEGITVNPSTNKVTVSNIDATGTLVYIMNSSFDSRHLDGPPRKIFAKWGYNNPGGVFNPVTTREWTQEFTYTGPR